MSNNKHKEIVNELLTFGYRATGLDETGQWYIKDSSHPDWYEAVNIYYEGPALGGYKFNHEDGYGAFEKEFNTIDELREILKQGAPKLKTLEVTVTVKYKMVSVVPENWGLQEFQDHIMSDYSDYEPIDEKFVVKEKPV